MRAPFQASKSVVVERRAPSSCGMVLTRVVSGNAPLKYPHLGAGYFRRSRCAALWRAFALTFMPSAA
jgi:hypothetical protein